MTISRNTLFALVVAVAVAAGWWLGASRKSPLNPNPDRPVLRAMASVVRTAARLGLWVALAGEEPPKVDTDARQQLVHSPVDEAGNPRVDHRRGW